ncbi:flagellar hook-basal body complex protein FliE [Methylorubrum podarium]|jgi:flagellar hook-basal body complex protein FliE|uniref:flagellar hook-basal body complex protein FliE n=1 Tax=Methylorubrum podarium TaxID=200476 RepID=UPI001EE390D4|nr:flagellar hook-basal body complex protein FliE [Methylorubrum podarium]GJE69290.1 Flagellar hook-basal body complex protein FliE [Methylorubrum podarium]
MPVDHIISAAKGSNFLKPGDASAGSDVASGSFSKIVTGLLQDSTEAGQRADLQIRSAALGQSSVVDVVTAVAESETALQTLVAVRDRAISAYEEVMRTAI